MREVESGLPDRRHAQVSEDEVSGAIHVEAAGERQSCVPVGAALLRAVAVDHEVLDAHVVRRSIRARPCIGEDVTVAMRGQHDVRGTPSRSDEVGVRRQPHGLRQDERAGPQPDDRTVAEAVFQLV